MELNVALLQLDPSGNDQAANLEKGEAACRRAAAMGADVALFPEMWNIGYTYEGPRPKHDLLRAPRLWTPETRDDPGLWAGAEAEWKQRAVSEGSPFVEHFRELAHELGMAIAITYLRKTGSGVANCVSLFDCRGETVLRYAKVHTCAFDLPEAWLEPGDGFRVGKLETRSGEVQVGAMICFDREFPESARVLTALGAEIVLVPNACPLDRHRLDQFRVRALENAFGVAMANYAAPKFNGHSVAFDPIGYTQAGMRDNLVIEAGEQEGVYLARFDLDAMREYRDRDAWAVPFRRPDRYAAILEDTGAVFPRIDAEGRTFGV